jgi:hypothetical protein
LQLFLLVFGAFFVRLFTSPMDARRRTRGMYELNTSLIGGLNRSLT